MGGTVFVFSLVFGFSLMFVLNFLGMHLIKCKRGMLTLVVAGATLGCGGQYITLFITSKEHQFSAHQFRSLSLLILPSLQANQATKPNAITWERLQISKRSANGH